MGACPAMQRAFSQHSIRVLVSPVSAETNSRIQSSQPWIGAYQSGGEMYLGLGWSGGGHFLSSGND